jgi:uncharacterized RDD family membrane protein YckC
MAYQPQRDPTNVLGRRFGAFFIDFVLGSAISIAFLAATKSASYTGAPDSACDRLRDVRGFSGTCLQFGSRVYTWDSGRYLLGILLGTGVVFLNAVILQGITGASVGKMITGVRVVNAEGNVAGIGRAFIRWILLFVDLLCAGIVGLVTVLATHPHRRVGDMAAGTYVIGTADVGQPVVALTAPSYAYAGAPAPGGWVPPQAAQPGWGTPPPPQPSQWGPPPTEAQPSQWGAPPAQAQPQPAWPPASPPPQQPSWGPPPSGPQQQPAPPSQPAEEQAGWAAPQSPQQQPYVPPPPPSAPPSAPPAQPAPPSWGAPPAPAPEPPAATPPAQNGGESWWNKGVDEGNPDDDER